ncbi:MAG: hypothetical protein NTY38_05940, partial [Acidobacteria bacterium]|nr:hypothetical protein [Acidobacteriota bacterium]
MRYLACPTLFFLLTAPLFAAQRLPRELPPEIYAWFWTDETFAPGGITRFLDVVSRETNYNFLTTSLRTPQRENIRPEVRDQIRQAALAAHERGLRMAFDLDPRLARQAFQKAHPGELQWMLRIRAFPWPASAPGDFAISSLRMDDHMTWPDAEYERLSGKLVRAWFVRGSEGAATRLDAAVTATEQSGQRVRVSVAPGAGRAGDTLVLAVAFEYRTPDVFAASLNAFQESIFELYRDVPLDGAMKDEWGFPPTRGKGGKDGAFWYSTALASAWRRAGGGDLVDDCLLMSTGIGGDLNHRLGAINRFMRLTLERKAAIEQHFYATTKRTFGPDAFVGTHATWGIWPEGDIFKNGLDWWQATRDYGQTDEDWPMPVRTALAKKMGKPVWYNQYYSRDGEPYFDEIRRDAANGGRVNIHPLFPGNVSVQGQHDFLTSASIRRTLSRVRLLNYFAAAPIDSPAAVVFGHAAALNWVTPHFTDFGIEIADELGRAGYRADVIPSTEIASGALRIDDRGNVRYGVQRYRALVFVNPEFEPESTFEFLRRAARSTTRTYLRGASLYSFEGASRAPVPLPEVMEFHGAAQVVSALEGAYRPNRGPASLSRLTDGSCVLVAAKGEPMRETFDCGSARISFEATGVFAIRLAAKGALDRLAASELKSLTIDGTRYDFPRPLDLALWHDSKGVWQGVV